MKLRTVGLIAILGVLIASCGGAMVERAAGPTEGIQVHGDWTIDIYNEDGSLDRTLEFENALVGGNFIAAVLDGSFTPGQWLVRLYGGAASGPCQTSSPTFGECVFTATTEPDVANASLVVNASGTAETDGDIAIVDTKYAICGGGDVAPVDCRAEYDPLFDNTGAALTEKTLADVEPVSAGQSIQVEVVISFTSG